MIGIYCRISKNKDEGVDVSIEIQKNHGIEFAKNKEEEFKIYVDQGVSGKKEIDQRPSLKEMLADIDNDIITSVYCFDQSRLERNNRVWNVFVSICQDKNCKYFEGSSEVDLGDISIALQKNIMSIFHEYYSDMTSVKVTAAKKEKAKQGKTHGLIAFGFNRDENNNYCLNENEADIVRHMYQLYLEGYGCYKIADILNKNNTPTKMNQFSGVINRVVKYTGYKYETEKNKVKWRGNVVHDILKNPMNKGERYWNGEFACKLEVQVVDEEIWEKVNNKLTEHSIPAGRKTIYNYLLNDITNCYNCGGKIVGKILLKSKAETYRCKAKRELNTCSKNIGISIVNLENFIIRLLFYTKELKELLLNAPRKSINNDFLKTEIDKIRIDRDKAIKGKGKLYSLLTDPDLEADERIKEDYKNITAAIKALERQLSTKEAEFNNLSNNTAFEKAKSAIENYTDGIEFSELKKLVHSLIKKIDIEVIERLAGDKTIQLFRIYITFVKDDICTIFYCDRFAKHWIWDINNDPFGHYNESLSAENKLTYKKYQVENNNGKICQVTFGKITLPDKNDLIRFNFFP